MFSVAAETSTPLVFVARGSGIDVKENTVAAFALTEVFEQRSTLAEKHIPYIAVASSLLIGTTYTLAAQADFFFSIEDTSLIYMGPRVVELYEQMPLPIGFQKAEWIMNHGHIDAVVPETEVRRTIAGLTQLLSSSTSLGAETPKVESIVPQDQTDLTLWLNKVNGKEHPSPRQLIDDIADNFVELRGDRTRYNDPHVFGGIAEINGRTVVVIGSSTPDNIDAEIRHAFSHPRPAGIRKAIRLVKLASRLDVPLVTLITCSGPAAEIRSEEEGLAGLIGQLAGEIVSTTVRTVGLVVGPSEGMVALCLSMTDSLIMTEHSYLSALGLRALGFKLFRDATRIADAAKAGYVTPASLVESGRAKKVLPSEPMSQSFTENIKAAVEESLLELSWD